MSALEMVNIYDLLQEDGKPCLTDEDKTVSKKCPICDADMELFLALNSGPFREPVFLCKSEAQHSYGTLRFIPD